MNQKVIIITGLTCSGKSSLAMRVAKEYSGEIISADSVQIYKDLNIGSAKESKQNRSIIPHHLIDIKDINETYNVGEYILDCQEAIKTITEKGKLPIIVGGTGLYIKALLEGYTFGNTGSNEDFRSKMQELAKQNGNEYVWNLLHNKNSKLANTVHYNNLKRVIRYLEIEEFGQCDNQIKFVSILQNYDVLALGVIENREIIYDKINKRVDDMIRSGLIEEVQQLIKNGAKSDMQSMNTIGYKEWFNFFEGVQTKDKTIDLIKQHTRNYCKRQLTFLKTINGLSLMKIDEAKNKIEEFLYDKN